MDQLAMEEKSTKEVDDIEAKCSELGDDEFVEAALCHQNIFVKAIQPEESNKWEKDELRLFRLKLDSINRVYLNQQLKTIYDDDHDDYDGGEIIITDSLELYVRAKYKDKNIFVGLCYKVCEEGNQGNRTSISGILTLTYDVEIFSKSMVKFYFHPDNVYKSLIKDGYRYVYIF